MEATQLVTIFEGVNEALKERYMGSTTLLPEELEERLEMALPLALSHWTRAGSYSFRCVHYAVPRAAVVAFCADFAAQNPRPGWKDIQGGELI